MLRRDPVAEEELARLREAFGDLVRARGCGMCACGGEGQGPAIATVGGALTVPRRGRPWSCRAARWRRRGRKPARMRSSRRLTERTRGGGEEGAGGMATLCSVWLCPAAHSRRRDVAPYARLGSAGDVDSGRARLAPWGAA